MASIIKKKIKNQTYYYYAESKRVNGKPTLVNQKYLGTAKKLMESMGVPFNINRLIDEMAGIKRIFTFFGDMNAPEKVESFTVGSELAEQVERLYNLKEKYSQKRYS